MEQWSDASENQDSDTLTLQLVYDLCSTVGKLL
jgi:hypothetical protein